MLGIVSEIFWFRIPMWVTEFDWNGDLDEPDVPWDYEEYARILDDFYTLMFSQEVTQLLVFLVRFSSKCPRSRVSLASWPGNKPPLTL